MTNPLSRHELGQNRCHGNGEVLCVIINADSFHGTGQTGECSWDLLLVVLLMGNIKDCVTNSEKYSSWSVGVA